MKLLKHKRTPLIIVLMAVIGLGVVAFFSYRTFQRATPLSLKRGPVIEAVYGLGTVTANKTFTLKLGITSTVTKLFVEEGSVVKSGDLLVRFDEGIVYKAPFSGVITSLNYKLGETVFPQTPILTLTDLQDRYVTVNLEQQGALRIKPNQSVRLSFEQLRAEEFTGAVKSVYPNNGQFLVQITVDQLPPAILPGMTADVAIQVARRKDVLLVPVVALTNGQVLRIRQGKRAKIPLKVGTTDGLWAEVLDGDLLDSDSVIKRKN